MTGRLQLPPPARGVIETSLAICRRTAQYQRPSTTLRGLATMKLPNELCAYG